MNSRPKRRRDKYNPYCITVEDGRCFVSFKDGEKRLQKVEIEKELFDEFDYFERRDLSILNEWDRHIEQSELTESTFNKRAADGEDDLEDIVLQNIQNERLHKAIDELPEVQRRRLKLYYFEDLTYEQIAEREGCTKMPVKRAINKAMKLLKFKLKKEES